MQTELEYTKKVLGEGSGATYELVIQTPSRGGSVLSAQSLLLHYKALRAATKISVQLFDRSVVSDVLKQTTASDVFPSF